VLNQFYFEQRESNYSASISRSVALPRNAVGGAPPHGQPHVCHVPLGK